MKDYYLYDDVPVLRNLLNIKDEKLLLEAESNITYIKLLDKNDKISQAKSRIAFTMDVEFQPTI